MLSQKEQNLIKSLHTLKGRTKSGLCLVEGAKNIMAAKDAVKFIFSSEQTADFKKLVTTKTPQNTAAVAKIPQNTFSDIQNMNTIILLDGVQDPGNVGTIIRLCQGFMAGLILVESADPTSPKTIRSSAGAVFEVPWIKISRPKIIATIKKIPHKIYRLEAPESASIHPTSLSLKTKFPTKTLFIAGSEGQGIKLAIKGENLVIPHQKELESLNVAQSAAILLWIIYAKKSLPNEEILNFLA